MNETINCVITMVGKTKDGEYITDVYKFTTERTEGEVVNFSIYYFKDVHPTAAITSFTLEYETL